MTRLGVHQLDGSTASTGHVPTRQADGSVAWAAAGGGGSSSLPWFTVTDAAYGATGDGTTDDTAAINAAIAALNTAGRGVLYFPAGTYKTTAGLTAITASAYILGDGSADKNGAGGASLITSTSPTADLFTLSGHRTTVDSLALQNTSAAETAGAGIRVTAGDRNRYVNVSISGFHDCMNVEDGEIWSMTACHLYGPVRYGLYIRHIDSPDGGDMVISDSTFYAANRNSQAAIRQESGGGMKVANCKINDDFGSGRFAYGIDLAISAVTGILLLTGLSIENITVTGIRITKAGAGSFQGIVIDGVQIGFYQAGSNPAIDISSVRDITLDGLVLFAYPSRSCPAIQLTSVDNVAVGDRITRGFTGGYVATTSTNVVDGMAGGGAVTSVNGETGAVVLDAADVGAAEASHTHGSSGGELLMQDGVTSPPVPLETEDGSDWLYEG